MQGPVCGHFLRHAHVTGQTLYSLTFKTIRRHMGWRSGLCDISPSIFTMLKKIHMAHHLCAGLCPHGCELCTFLAQCVLCRHMGSKSHDQGLCHKTQCSVTFFNAHLISSIAKVITLQHYCLPVQCLIALLILRISLSLLQLLFVQHL